MISFGVPAGTMIPAQVPQMKSGTPCSAMVGTLAVAGMRSCAVTGRARRADPRLAQRSDATRP
jgi:hypothetical protein